MPKLEAAKTIVPEWEDLDAEAKRVEDRVMAGHRAAQDSNGTGESSGDDRETRRHAAVDAAAKNIL